MVTMGRELQLYYHEEDYYEYYLTIESPAFKETDKINFYYTGIVIKKIEDDSSIKSSFSNIIGKEQ